MAAFTLTQAQRKQIAGMSPDAADRQIAVWRKAWDASQAKQNLVQQQRAENTARLAGTQRQQSIVTGERPIDVGISRPKASQPTSPRTTGVVTSAPSQSLASALATRSSTSPTNVAELRSLYAKALSELQRQQGVSRGNISGAVSRMKADPMNTANAYAALQAVTPVVAGNPVAEYAAAAGLSAQGAAEAQRLAEADAAAYQAASQNIADIMRASQEAANQSRMADIGLIETGGTQDLETQANMLNLLLKQGEIGAVTGLQQRNLENEIAMRNALTGQVSNIFAGQDVAPESILKLIEATMAKLNMNRWA